MIARLLQRSYSCRQAVELVTDYLEGALSPAEAARLEGHLADCPGCAQYLRQVQATIELLGHVEPSDLAPATREGLLALYRDFHADV